ncbi:hypothetical protein ACLOJK_019741 [Asimina triloba]
MAAFTTFVILALLAFQAHSLDKIPFVIPKPNPTPAANKVMNKIDACWRSDPDWASNRRRLADCSVGFGQAAVGGKFGAFYLVTDPSDDPINPKPGTLRYGAIQTQPLWIIFQRDMLITLKNELIMNSFKTIDGRGAKVLIANGPCITVQGVSNVIIHGLILHDCRPGAPGLVRSTPTHLGRRRGSDGDAISIFASSNIWVDHCSLSHSADGLIDVIHGSTAVTISNNYFFDHDKVMLLGHKDNYAPDKIMKVTVVLNHFGPGCVERMPRVRTGYAHVANNRYDDWKMYAIGGSSNPTILSEGNYFDASNNQASKQVTKREAGGGWKDWKWRSTNDVFVNGAFFVPSDRGSAAPAYTPAQSFTAAPGSMVLILTAAAGPLQCAPKKQCKA